MRQVIPLGRRSESDPNYCIYSGKNVDPLEMDDEHVIPRSLGGTPAVVIRVLKTLNSRLGSEIDAKVARDGMIQFGRRDAKARGNNRKVPVPVFRNAALWTRGQRLDELEPRYNIEIREQESLYGAMIQRQAVS